MIQAYSENIAVTTSSVIPFNSTTLKTGRTATLEGNGTISLNCAGIYSVVFSGYGSSTADGTVGAKLQANGVDVAQAKTTATATAGNVVPIVFTTLITVQPCMSKKLNVIYTGSAGTLGLGSVMVTKLR